MFVRHGTDDRSVTGSRNAPPTKWRSFHVYVPGSVDLFLVRQFYPALAEAYSSRLIRRFFFIRYLDPGLHLRLRFTSGKTGGLFSFEEWLGRMLQEFSGSGAETAPYRIEQQDYDRTEHYFGETMQSVYSELLNEQTSWLGLRLLSGYHQRQPELRALLASWLAFLFANMADDRKDFLRIIDLSWSFSARVLAQIGLHSDAPKEHEQTVFDSLLPQVRERSITFLNDEPAVKAILSLCRRARQEGDKGEFVVTHALHLFCNKLGVSMQDEYRMFTLLKNNRGNVYD